MESSELCSKLLVLFGAIISQDLGGFLFISAFVIDDEGTDCFLVLNTGRQRYKELVNKSSMRMFTTYTECPKCSEQYECE